MEALQALRVLHNILLVVLCGSAPVPYEGLYIEALRVLFNGLMLVVLYGVLGWSLKVLHEGLKVLWGAG